MQYSPRRCVMPPSVLPSARNYGPGEESVLVASYLGELWQAPVSSS